MTGLNGSVVLQNSNGDDLTLTANGAFSFSTALVSGTAYVVTVKTAPGGPVAKEPIGPTPKVPIGPTPKEPVSTAQSCVVSNGIGTVSTANVSNMVVTCTTLLTITSTTPLDNAVNELRTTTPVIQFSAAVNPATITTTNITLTSPVGSKSITFTVAGNQVTIQPVGRLLPMTQYTLTISPAVRGLAGEVLLSSATMKFTVRDGAWDRFNPKTVEVESGNASDPQIAFDANGNALAVWQQKDATRYNIWANRFVAGTGVGAGWGTATLIETDNAGNATSPQIAFDASGNALAVWQQSDGTRNDIWSNRFVMGMGWATTATRIENGTGNTNFPQIAVDASGNALAVWQQSDGTRYNALASRYVVGTGWDTTATLIEKGDKDVGSPQIAIDSKGNAIAVWEQSDGTRYNIWANRYVAGTGVGTGWSADATLIETDDLDYAFGTQVAVDASGNAIAVWQQSNGTYYYIWSNRYVAGIGWGTAARIEVGNLSDAELPQIAVDASGNVLAVWQESDGTRTNIWANRFE